MALFFFAITVSHFNQYNLSCASRLTMVLAKGCVVVKGCGVVWRGMVWYRMLLCGVAWYAVAWYDVLCGVAWYAVEWCVVWCGVV